MVSLCHFDEDFLEKSWYWLNDPEIKELTSTPDFTREAQKLWFDSLPGLKNYKIWGIKFNDLPVGACGLKNITDSDCEYWCYIGEKSMWGKGIGKIILDKIYEKANELHLTEMWMKVKATNLRSVNLFIKSGFIVRGQTEKNELILRIKFNDSSNGNRD